VKDANELYFTALAKVEAKDSTTNANELLTFFYEKA